MSTKSAHRSPFNPVPVLVAALIASVSAPMTCVAEITETVSRIEDTSASIIYEGHWQHLTGAAWSGGTAASGGVVDETSTWVTKAILNFEGTGVRWFGKRGPSMGFARVFLDGRLMATIDAYAPRESIGAVLFTASGLASSTHSLVIHVAGTKNSASTFVSIAVDAFDVTSTERTGSDVVPPTVTITLPSGGSASGTIAVAADASDAAGIAGVQFFLDGAPLHAEDETAPYRIAWDTTTTTHAEGALVTQHVLTAVARDVAGNIAVSAAVTVGVATGSPLVTVRRVEQNSAQIVYAGEWQHDNTDRDWSGGTAAVSPETSARATVTFTGTAAAWIGFRGPQAGVAQVFVDGTHAATVDAFAATEELHAVLFEVTGLADAQHTLTIEVTGEQNPAAIGNYVVIDALDIRASHAGMSWTFVTGDVFVSLETGSVQRWRPDGTLYPTLWSAIRGTGAGMGFDQRGRLFVTRGRLDQNAAETGNITEMFETSGNSRGGFGTGYDCDPHAIVFDAAGTAYVGQAGCSGAILKIASGQAPVALPAAAENQGASWIDLASDGCTIFYTSSGPNVKRFDACAGVQLADFNVAGLPGDAAQDLRILPDGGVLVSSGDVIARLDAAGVVVHTYRAPEEFSRWSGIDLAADGTFWAANYESSNLYRFDLATGAVLSGFNTGTPPHTVVGVRVRK
jgi:Bacterial Ig domain